MTELQTPAILSSKYRFQKLLGEGSNGKTYLAININNGIHVAIKELKFNQAKDYKSLELFKREAAILSSINLEGVPKFYESIFSDNNDETCYIIQEFVEYPSVQSLLNEVKKLSERETLHIGKHIAQIIYGLQTIYTPPIIHRDIKPSNIMYQRGTDKIFLIDFGAVANPQHRTGGSTIAGTFGYMAPEQLLGDISIQSDYYGLGATMLHLLTGVPPYQMDSNGFELDLDTVLNEHAPSTSEAMRSLLAVLIAPEIDKRPPNASILTTMFRQVETGHIVSVERPQDTLPVFKQRSKFVKWFLNLFSHKNVNPEDDKNWKHATGIIRNIRPITDVNGYIQTAYEYTFVVNNKTYAGLQVIDAKGSNSIVNNAMLNSTVMKNTDTDKRDDASFQCVSGVVVPKRTLKTKAISSECSVFYQPKNPRLNFIVV